MSAPENPPAFPHVRDNGYHLVTDEGDLMLSREDLTYAQWEEIKAENARRAARKPSWPERLVREIASRLKLAARALWKGY